MLEVFIAAVSADEVGSVVANGEFGYENQDFLTISEYVLAEVEDIR